MIMSVKNSGYISQWWHVFLFPIIDSDDCQWDKPPKIGNHRSTPSILTMNIIGMLESQLLDPNIDRLWLTLIYINQITFINTDNIDLKIDGKLKNIIFNKNIAYIYSIFFKYIWKSLQ